MSTSPISSPVTISNPTFTGVSKFASSLQQVLARAVGIASLPLSSLQAGLTTLNNRQSALQTLDANFSNLQQSISQLQGTVNSGLLSPSVSNSSVVSATVGAGALAGTYSIEVDNLGSWSTALSNAGSTPVTDPTTQGITNAPSVTLSVGTSTTTITPASSSLQDLVSAINTQAAGQVQATLVNVGSTASPDYRLSLVANKLGANAVGLTDSLGANLISTSTPGVLASYKVDGTDSITSDSRTVSLSTGLTVSLVGQSVSGQATTISVQNDSSTLASAFSSFVTAYNSAASALSQEHGSGGGPLQGDSIVQSLGGVLSQLGTYTNGSPANALANFGVTLFSTGQLSFDSAAFTTAANANFSTLVSTLGTSTSGGFLQTAANLLSGVEDSATGTLPSEENSVAGQITTQQTLIANEQATVTQLQTNLTAEISKADAAIASLESQVSYVTGLFATYTGANSTQSNGLSTL
jgi:flagellar hook-associated protein 2